MPVPRWAAQWLVGAQFCEDRFECTVPEPPARWPPRHSSHDRHQLGGRQSNKACDRLLGISIALGLRSGQISVSSRGREGEELSNKRLQEILHIQPRYIGLNSIRPLPMQDAKRLRVLHPHTSAAFSWRGCHVTLCVPNSPECVGLRVDRLLQTTPRWSFIPNFCLLRVKSVSPRPLWDSVHAFFAAGQDSESTS